MRLSERPPVLLALDQMESVEHAAALVQACERNITGFKLGMHWLAEFGRAGALRLMEQFPQLLCFWDQKHHDVPRTVEDAVRAYTRSGFHMMDVHTAGGFEMMRRAVEAARHEADLCHMSRPKMLGITVLTSLDEGDLTEIGVTAEPQEVVLRRARLAKDSGLDGVVCSPLEVAAIRKECGPGFLLITPGIRPAGGDPDDQKRLATPKVAVRNGADLLVIGSAIRNADDPAAAARAIAKSLGFD